MSLCSPFLGAIGVCLIAATTVADDVDPFQLAGEAINAGRLDEATSTLLAVVEKNPGDGDALTILGNIAMLQGDAGAAATHYYGAIDADPGRADFHNNLALHQLRCGAFTKAYDSLLTAERLDPNNIPTLYNLGTMLLTSRDPRPAADYFRRILAIDPTHAGAHYKLGALYMAAGAPTDAIREYEAALEDEPGLVDCRVDLGLALLQQGEAHVAASHFRKAIDQDPDHPAARYGLGLTMRQWGFIDAAIEHIASAAELAPANADYRIDLGIAYLESGRPDAVAMCEQLVLEALAVQPDHVRANTMAGVYYSDAGQPALAVACLQRAVDLGNADPDVQLSLARNLVKVGEVDKARPILDRLLKDLPKENEVREQARALLKST